MLLGSRALKHVHVEGDAMLKQDILSSKACSVHCYNEDTIRTSDNQHLYNTFCKRIQSAAVYYYGIKKIVTVISLHVRVLLAKCTPYQHLDCNISHDQYLPDALRSTKQLRLSILPKDSNMLALAVA